MARVVHDHDSAEGLLPLEDARERVIGQIHALPPIELPLTDAYGCVAAADIAATLDLPEFASSRHGRLRPARRRRRGRHARVAGRAQGRGRAMIGQRPDATVGMGEAVKIATGAPIPAGADAVVPVENAEGGRGSGPV